LKEINIDLKNNRFCSFKVIKEGDMDMIKKIVDLFKSTNNSKQISLDKTVRIQQAYIKEIRTRDLLNDNIELTEIPDVFQLLLSSDENIKLQAATVISNVLNSLILTDLIKLDIIFRERTSYEWYYEWSNSNPIELLHPLMAKEEKFSILGLSSFHPSGYFREKAILALSDMNTGGAIPYILIRLNDWVRQVRIMSQKQIKRYLKPEYARDFVRNLPLVLRLKECSRDDHLEVVNSVISIISSEEGSNELINGLETDDPKLRLACYKIILQTKLMDTRTIIKNIMKDSNPFNRLFVLKNIKSEVTREDFLVLLK